MKKLIILLFFIPVFVNAQTTHTVTAKETLYSIGREYNIHPKELAAYNNIPFDKGLTLGQVIKIPAKGKLPVFVAPPSKTDILVKETVARKITPTKTGAIKAQPVNVEMATAMVPIYHKVAKKETLYHISKLYNKVPVADIKKWNHLTANGVSEGTELIVGYKKVSKENALKVAPIVITELPVNTKTEEPVGKDLPVKNPPVLQAIPLPTSSEVKTVAINPVTGKNFTGGFFKNLYSKQLYQKIDEKGEAGVFKSTSGWEDGKYYCLHNKAHAGSIIKITSTATNKTIYAKVLDVMPDLKQNSGLIMRLSNAAAAELGVDANNFECTINY